MNIELSSAFFHPLGNYIFFKRSIEMILTEEQKEELTQCLSKLDDNHICFGNIFADIQDIVKVVTDYLEELN